MIKIIFLILLACVPFFLFALTFIFCDLRVFKKEEGNEKAAREILRNEYKEKWG